MKLEHEDAVRIDAAWDVTLGPLRTIPEHAELAQSGPTSASTRQLDYGLLLGAAPAGHSLSGRSLAMRECTYSEISVGFEPIELRCHDRVDHFVWTPGSDYEDRVNGSRNSCFRERVPVYGRHRAQPLITEMPVRLRDADLKYRASYSRTKTSLLSEPNM